LPRKRFAATTARHRKTNFPHNLLQLTIEAARKLG
jgi:hypothetical protein